MLNIPRDELTAREREQNQHEVEMFSMQAEHTQKVKAMEYETKKTELTMRAEAAAKSRESAERIRNAELELARLEARWLSWLRIPITVVRLPLYIVLGVAYCIAVARKHEPSERFWNLLK